MSQQENNNQPTNPYLINTYGKSTSRLNKNWLNNPPRKSEPLANTESHKDDSKQPLQNKDTYRSLLPNRVSELSPSVIFQDADGRKAQGAPQSSRRSQEGPDKVEEKIATNANLGLISNAFMGATTKFQKMTGQMSLADPAKKLEEIDNSSIYKKSQTGSQASTAKISRRREIRESEPNIDILNFRDQSETASRAPTDRSNIEGKRIERKQERGKVFKAMNKKDTNGQEKVTEEASKFGDPGDSKLTKETSSNIVEPLQQNDPYSTPASKTYRPIQRQNANRSRISSQSSQLISQSKEQDSKIGETQTASELVQPVKSEQKQANAHQKQPIQRRSYNRTKINQLQSEQPKPSSTQAFEGSQNQLNLKQTTVQNNKIDMGDNRQSEGISPGSKRSNSSFRKSEPDGSHLTEQAAAKRSIVAFWLFKRLLRHQLSDSFQTLYRVSREIKVHGVNQSSILAVSSQKIVKAKQHKLLEIGFDQLRRKYLASCLQQKKQLDKKPLANPANFGLTLLEKIFLSKLRAAFSLLNNKALLSNKTNPYLSIQKWIQIKKRTAIELGFQRVRQRASSKVVLLTMLSKGSQAFYLQQKTKAFVVLKAFKLPSMLGESEPKQKQATRSLAPIKLIADEQSKLPSPALIQKEQKLKALNNSICQGLQLLESDVSKARKNHEEVTAQLQSKIEVLRQHNEQIEAEVGSKRQQNERISRQLLTHQSKGPSQEVEQALQPNSTKLEALTNIYINHYKNPHRQVQVQDILTEYAVRTDTNNPTVNQWNLLLKNNDLKRAIASYEDTQLQPSKARQVILQEQQMILKLLRSYIKQQYFWQWLHVSVEGL